MIEHINGMHLIVGQGALLATHDIKRMLLFAATVFDAAVSELFVGLLNRSTVVVSYHGFTFKGMCRNQRCQNGSTQQKGCFVVAETSCIHADPLEHVLIKPPICYALYENSLCRLDADGQCSRRTVGACGQCIGQGIVLPRKRQKKEMGMDAVPKIKKRHLLKVREREGDNKNVFLCHGSSGPK
jgi:hypothetical protein